MNLDIEKQIFDIKNDNIFEKTALEIFNFQAVKNPIYKKYIEYLKIKPETVTNIREIPFLPIEFFKTKNIVCEPYFSALPKLTFKSSGTTFSIRSNHYIAKPNLYIESFVTTFEEHFGNIEDYAVLALLPSYLEAGNSSLVFMVDYLIKKSQNSASGFYLNEFSDLEKNIDKLLKAGQKVILFGVAYALLDFADFISTEKNNLIIVETGGMKGRKKELTRQELHTILNKAFGTKKILSEYGMTELLSQAYTQGDEWFTPAKTMKIFIRDINDPFSYIADKKTGGLNIIDLANIYSCSFIETKDLSVKNGNKFKVLGRFDNSDIRGCNLLINNEL